MELREKWRSLLAKYPEYRDEMSTERERAFVEDCFSLYEEEGFAKTFWAQGGDFAEYIGKPFSVIGRVEEYNEQTKSGADLECLPMWDIRFEDGTVISAYPDEIIPSERADHGCPASII